MTYFFWLASMAFQTAIFLWPVFLFFLFVIVLGLTIWIRQRPRPFLTSRQLFGCLTVTFIILLYGTLHADRGGRLGPPPFAGIAPFIVIGLLIGQLGMSISRLFKAEPGTRILLSGILGFSLCLSLSASFVALMSVTGDWI